MTYPFHVRLVVIAAFGISPCVAQESTRSKDRSQLLWWSKPAEKWEEAIPIGNGRLGAMVFGRIANERIQLNEDTLWAGSPYDPVNPDAKDALPEIRKLVNEAKYSDAAKLISAKVMAKPLGQMPYQTIGDLNLAFSGSVNTDEYRRELDLDTAITTVSYVMEEVRFTRETFSSNPDNVIVMRLTASEPGSLNFSAGMSTPMKAKVETDGVDTLVMSGVGGDAGGIPGKIRYQSRVKVMASGGKVSSKADGVSVEKADSAVILISAATSFKSFDDVSGDPEAIAKERIKAAAGKSFEVLRSAHLADYQPLFRRVSMDLGTSEAMKLPTDERIRKFAQGNDPHLAALYYQFGRYLLLGSSRPGSQPANLQGIWNEGTNPAWQSKYTININTEMNYWPAESGNLGECVEPLIKMVEDLTVTGSRTAKSMYGARGWMAHHNTDIWRATAPIDGPNWGMWPTGGAWLCLHLWDRYEFSADPAVLKRIYPVLKGASEFFIDTLQESPDGKWLVTNPSISPEIEHPHGSAVCAGPTMDQQILRDLFANTIKAGSLLGVDQEFRKQVAVLRARLSPNKVGSTGLLQEWYEDWDMQAGDKQHRHVSHLYGLYPGRDIHRRDTHEFAAAARKSLELRGDKATGWATAWRIGLWTHLGEGDRAYQILTHLLGPELTYPNMFDAHPPFQIDGNFGGAASIAEMLMQSRLGTVSTNMNHAAVPEIELLPALPSAWPAGSVKGLRARGGFEVDVTWKDGSLVEATVISLSGGAATLRLGSTTREIKLQKGGKFRWEGN
jgi:alpha-L-fucosidase 2